jgi:hypothetical protein
MNLDPTKMKDYEIAYEAEKWMKTVYQLGEEMGLTKEELLPYGHYVAKIDYKRFLKGLRIDLMESISMLPPSPQLPLVKVKPRPLSV